MKIRWSFRCYPTPEQEGILAQTFGCARFVYNWGLALRSKAYKDGEPINYAQSDKALTALKRDKDHLWLNDVSYAPLQQALRHLQSAYSRFFKKQARFPSFKKKGNGGSASYTRSAFKFDVGNQRLHVSKLGRLKVKWSRRVEVNPTTVTIIRRPSGKYFVSMVVGIQPPPAPKTGEDIGIDFGISRLATLSNGERVANPKFTSKYAKKLAKAQRQLAKKVKGSGHYKRARVRVARIHEKIGDSRKDVQAKLASDLVERFDLICVEDLNLRGMTKNHRLAKSLNDAAIGNAIRTIEAKAAMHGKRVVKADRWFPSSKTCSACGKIRSSLPLSVRNWTCECGAEHDRDENAAKNILSYGKTAGGHPVAARGGHVRVARSSERETGGCRSVNQPETLSGVPRL